MKQLRTSRLLRGLVAVVVLVQFALMLVMASSEGLHQKLHHHHEDGDHPCEVALFHHSGLEEALPPLTGVTEVVLVPLPEVLPPSGRVAVTATHLRGGVLAHSPPRGP